MNITYPKKGDYNHPDLVYSKNDYPPQAAPSASSRTV